MKTNRYRKELIRIVLFFGPLDRSAAKKRLRELLESKGEDFSVMTFNSAENEALDRKSIFVERDTKGIKEEYFRAPYNEEKLK